MAPRASISPTATGRCASASAIPPGIPPPVSSTPASYGRSGGHDRTSPSSPWIARCGRPHTAGVTRRRSGRERVRTEPALASAVVASMRDGLALHDSNGRLVLWNPAAEAITGWRQDEVARRGRFPADLPEGLVE